MVLLTFKPQSIDFAPEIADRMAQIYSLIDK